MVFYGYGLESSLQQLLKIYGMFYRVYCIQNKFKRNKDDEKNISNMKTKNCIDMILPINNTPTVHVMNANTHTHKYTYILIYVHTHPHTHARAHKCVYVCVSV